MYAYMLSLGVRDKNEETYECYNLETKLFLNANLQAVKDYALGFISRCKEEIETEEVKGFFEINTYKLDDSIESIFDEFLYKSDYYRQWFDMDGNEFAGEFMIEDEYYGWDNLLIDYFNPDYKPRYNIGDIIYFDDGGYSGIYVIFDTPAPITSSNINEAKRFYRIKGLSDEGNWNSFEDEIIDYYFKPIEEYKGDINPLIYILSDIALGKDVDLSNIDNEDFLYLLTI